MTVPPDRGMPLAGIGVLVTRPREQAARMMARLEARGAHAWWLPTLEIAAEEDVSSLATVLDGLAGADWAVFISPTAVQQGWPLLQARGGLPAGLQVAAVGQGTLRELAARGVRAVAPPPGQEDSEGLLALPEFAHMDGRRVAIFRGEGGRDLLAETLAARGAQVQHAVCYRRACPTVDVTEVAIALTQGRVQAVTVFSRESLANLRSLLGEQHWRLLCELPLFVPHARIAEYATGLGVQRPVVTASGEDGMLAAMEEYFTHGNAS